MKQKYLFCIIFLCFTVLPVICETKFTLNKSFSIKQVEPREKNIEISKKQIIYLVEKASVIKHELNDEYESFSTFILNNDNNTFSLNYVNGNTAEILYTITFISNNKIIINNTDIYLLKEDSYLRLYTDLLSDNSITSIFNFLSLCHYFFIDTILQELPIDFYKYKYDILQGSLLIQSPDSNLQLSHTVKYTYNKDGEFSIESKCNDDNFIGLNYYIHNKNEANFIRIINIKIKYFEKKSGKYDLNINYNKKSINLTGEIIHSYFTDIINYSYVTDVN